MNTALAPGISREASSRRRTLLALLLLAPVPSLGVIAAMVVAPGPAGHVLFVVGKLWLLTLPAAWHLLVDRGRPSMSPTDLRGLALGTATGVGMAAAIFAAAWIVGLDDFDAGPLRVAAAGMGLATPAAYLAGAAAWTLVNSLMEEYVYRWFVLTRCERLTSGAVAVGLAAGIFTLHHVIAVSRYLEPPLVVLASLGVFAGGVVWGWLYQRTRSIWPAWISHVLADAAVFALGWRLLFT